MNIERRENRFDIRGRYTTTPKMVTISYVIEKCSTQVIHLVEGKRNEKKATSICYFLKVKPIIKLLR